MEQVLRDKHGRLMGKIKEVSGKLEISDQHGKLLGKYDPKSDQTRDHSGRLIGKGNLLSSLLQM
ncbi:MAG: hypothetical protein ABSB79_03350 [Syntrophales bacterium]|jgi:hypothetical protein